MREMATITLNGITYEIVDRYLRSTIGDPGLLETVDKSTIVNAINELKSNSDDVDESKVKELIAKYLEENPPVPKFTINGEGPDENGNFTINNSNQSFDNNVIEF